jgi:FkbM family methyltransferase
VERYSQHLEQDFILQHLRDVPAGRFLDIGAYCPAKFSNVRALYELGWSGTLVELSPGPMRSLVMEYGNDPRITLIQAAVGIAPGLMTFHVTDDALSTSEQSCYDRWSQTKCFMGRMMVPAITLQHLNGGIGESKFDFVSIDTEGTSAQLFLRMLEIGMLPKCVCVEIDDRLDDIETAASLMGYTLLHENKCNAVFGR